MKTRPLEFRVWDGNKLFYSDDLNDSYVILNGRYAVPLILNGFDIDSEGIDGEGKLIFQQFTGLKDKKRKKIFEGDIVFHHGENQLIYWDSHSYGFRSKVIKYPARTYELINFHPMAAKKFKHEYEILGNIFENPEYLDKPKKS